MQTLVNFLEALIVSWVIVYTTYGLVCVAMRSVWWMVRFVSWVILYAAFGVTLLIVHTVWWMVRFVARLGLGDIQPSFAGNATAISRRTVAHEAKSMPAPLKRPAFPDVAISVREAGEALFAYEQRAFGARSEIGETITRTLETIAQTRALMAQVEAESKGIGRGPAS